MDLRQLIDNTRMSGYQWLIIAVAAFVNALDGYDLVAMAFSANAVTEEFDLSGSTLGWLLASALIGVGVGAVALAPLADRFGRKRLIVISLVITLAGLIATGFSSSVPELFVYRVITGIGVGGVLACVTVLTSEFSNLRFRGLAMAIYAAGYGLGASLCGTIASTFIPDHGWRIVFFAGAVLTTVALLAVLFFIPETPETLA
ncbi:MAG TPA: MFS transporter, partial [Corynebacterium urealyticum]|nr:MFS transporter [Corynebacterium urealyticum]